MKPKIMTNKKTTYNADTKVWRGLENLRNYGTECTLGKVALEAMLQNSTKIGQICYPSGKMYTNKELATLTISVAHYFTKLGVQQCDMIGIIASNSNFLAPLYFGAMLKGLIVSPLDVSFNKEGIKHICSITKPKLMFCDGDIYEKVKEALEEIDLISTQIYTMKDNIDGVPSINEFLTDETLDFNFEPLQMGHTQPATILCSSGTTGPPKGVTLSNEDLLNCINFKLSTVDRFLYFSTIHWLSGLSGLINTTLLGRTRVTSDRNFTADDCFDIVEKYRVNFLFGPPSQMALMLASPNIKTADLSSIKVYICAGSMVPYVLVQQLKKFMPNANLFTVYGSTEARLTVAAGELVEKTGRIGQLGPNMQIKIVDDNGKRLGPNDVGEFCFKTPYKWLGYYGNEQATAAAYDMEGWIITGDLGYINDQGTLYIVDRKKDILKYNNFHYFPTEIEQVIHELDDVVAVCVCGLPDLVATDLPTAAVVKRAGSNLTEQEVYEHVAKRMDNFKHLRGGVYFLDKLPLTNTGKVLRREVKSICEKLRNAN